MKTSLAMLTAIIMCSNVRADVWPYFEWRGRLIGYNDFEDILKNQGYRIGDRFTVGFGYPPPGEVPLDGNPDPRFGYYSFQDEDNSFGNLTFWVQFDRGISDGLGGRYSNLYTRNDTTDGIGADGGGVSAIMGIDFYDSRGTALDSDERPTEIRLRDWDTITIGMSDEEEHWQIYGELFGTRSVPDGGSSIALFALMFGCLGFFSACSGFSPAPMIPPPLLK